MFYINPSFYRRYVDDTFCLFEGRDDALKFLDLINNLHPSIKFDMEEEKDGKLEFLDTITSRIQGSAHLKLSTEIKKTDEGLFYHFSSVIPHIYKLNLVSTLVYRIYKIASTMIIFDFDVDLLEK